MEGRDGGGREAKRRATMQTCMSPSCMDGSAFDFLRLQLAPGAAGVCVCVCGKGACVCIAMRGVVLAVKGRVIERR